MAMNKLSSSEVCLILKECANAGVLELKFGTLSVSFGKSPKGQDILEPREHVVAPKPAAEMVEVNHKQQTKESLAQMECELREDQIAELLITDPLEAERLIAEGDLEEDDQTTDGEEGL